MKTQNLMPWCSLFSIASKFNIEVYKSYYKILVFLGLSQLIVSLFLLYFTYAYQLALLHAVITVLLITALYSRQYSKRTALFDDKSFVFQFDITNQGLCTFDGQDDYQLQANSRLSFLGCWLFFVAASSDISNDAPKHKRLFIFRDSLTEQDFSRLSAVLERVNS